MQPISRSICYFIHPFCFLSTDICYSTAWLLWVPSAWQWCPMTALLVTVWHGYSLQIQSTMLVLFLFTFCVYIVFHQDTSGLGMSLLWTVAVGKVGESSLYLVEVALTSFCMNGCKTFFFFFPCYCFLVNFSENAGWHCSLIRIAYKSLPLMIFSFEKQSWLFVVYRKISWYRSRGLVAVYFMLVGFTCFCWWESHV